MKRLILVISIIALTPGILEANFYKKLNSVENPNGKPWTLTIFIPLSCNSSDYCYGDAELTLPITNFLTFRTKANSYLDWTSFDMGYLPYSQSSSLGSYVFVYDYELNTSTNIGIDVHIPLYKLWEK